MIYHDTEQGSDAWWNLHSSVPTASNFYRILTPKTMKPSASRRGLIAELIGNRLSRYAPPRVETYTSRAMAHGLQTEEEARRWYALTRNVDVQNGGFCLTDDSRFGCSPDGIIGLQNIPESPNRNAIWRIEGCLELKCPQADTHAGYLLEGGELPDDYRCQVHGQLIVTGARWVDFVSYHPGLPPLLLRVYPDEFTEVLRKALDEFHEEYLKALYRVAGKPRPETGREDSLTRLDGGG